MIELEKTYLVKYLPRGLKRCPHKKIVDVYFPHTRRHPFLRLRKNGERYEITKKRRVHPDSWTEQREETIPLDRAEFENLSEAKGKEVRKMRYYYPVGKRTAEIDVFGGRLRGLVLADFEFKNKKEIGRFTPPEFCLADVTQEKFIAGGMLCGKKYSDIEGELKRFGYVRQNLEARS
ncbi:MAG: hypothetical protein FJY98_03215 [Candidatus Liptonbacteria bacterium]|nr:hypothetical protein [Candidatus Liptonbacteria bacterium]